MNAFIISSVRRPLVDRAHAFGHREMRERVCGRNPVCRVSHSQIPSLNLTLSPRAVSRGHLPTSSTPPGIVWSDLQSYVPAHSFFSFGGARWALVVKILLDQTVFALYLNSAYCALMGVSCNGPVATLRFLARMRPHAVLA